MAFPSSPTDGQVHDSGSISYTFNAATNSWLRNLVTEAFVNAGDSGGSVSNAQLAGEVCDFELFYGTSTLTDSIHTLDGCLILWLDGDFIQWN